MPKSTSWHISDSFSCGSDHLPRTRSPCQRHQAWWQVHGEWSCVVQLWAGICASGELHQTACHLAKCIYALPAIPMLYVCCFSGAFSHNVYARNRATMELPPSALYRYTSFHTNTPGPHGYEFAPYAFSCFLLFWHLGWRFCFSVLQQSAAEPCTRWLMWSLARVSPGTTPETWTAPGG